MNRGALSRLAGIEAPVHGGAPLPAGMIDFSISINPFPLPENVRAAFISSWDTIGSYPDADCRLLTQSLSGCFNIPAECLLLTNGSTEAFSLIASAFLGPGKKAMVLTPCYSDYEHVSRLSGADVHTYALAPETGFKPDLTALLTEFDRVRPDLVWICNPCNPSGTVFEPELIGRAAELLGSWGGVAVIDEAYAAFREQQAVDKTPAPAEADSRASNIILIRSLTKDFGIPGLRLGFLSCDPGLVGAIKLYKPCWSVSVPAQKTGVALFEDIEYFRESWRKTFSMQNEFIEDLRELGINPVDASENLCGAFVFFKSPSSMSAADFYSGMFKRGVRLRDCASMGAEGYFRAGVKLKEDNLRFIRAVKEVLSSAGESE